MTFIDTDNPSPDRQPSRPPRERRNPQVLSVAASPSGRYLAGTVGDEILVREVRTPTL